MEKSFLTHLQWRNAEKHFDPERKISQEYLDEITHAIQFAPSSFGLQPFHVTIVTDPDVRAKLKEAAWNQAQVTDCSHFFVFSSRTDLKERIEKYFQIATGGDMQKREEMKAYEGMMQGFAEGKSKQEIENWADRQAYLALGFGLAACAELEVDSCPMEGFDPSIFDQILSLPENFHSVVCMAVGYRKDMPHFPKVRFEREDLFTMM